MTLTAAVAATAAQGEAGRPCHKRCFGSAGRPGAGEAKRRWLLYWRGEVTWWRGCCYARRDRTNLRVQ
ncbi:hypothetical protein PR202_gb05330 [Eleusine coracana subsp. coracana]|uniref:Secreted protein n=1 Tax=Eleusine coracana subsp. coracana TaxID=191504 RepID=A0AAV5E476_ELECO|nr:hypothetical protein PR202_gb05330 [Eleusine coracana subsp. coracana]